ncbi:LysR family transcriptional regulator [Pseudomonas plecoglossicida]|uniref:LysR family transcriptional regulator n=1 Tax=Pseudomonas TaxID=286 RepID=UPI00166AF58A|nr:MULTISPECIES: LysR family transcriptional regulator [Pseudomonas]MDH1932198.1 LysR family transcriptional regulator [Pseudomonas sp. GD03696]MDM1714516.1 LysR family transcriptional regulator [Pseudomonas sp. 165]MDQ7967615.1 LysR family transcriptional regulator [Pseudomonas plecoglossicida]QNT41782.1 LysR family transcriptional regulator [Pseudomonas asiatica]WFG03819.1 LysR family transcriptional regulator [Pseudomonas putida]
MPVQNTTDLPNLMHLRTLVRVADNRTLTNAARKMLRSPSVVHDGIGELETQLGVSMFERVHGGWKVTAEGNCVLLRARRILAELAVLPAILGQPPVTVHEQLYLLNARRLIAFVKLCRLRNMGRVASVMDVTQPAISSAIKAMEAGTNVKLFERHGRGVHPTDVALAILPAIRRSINELSHIAQDLAALAGEISGKVRIGALPLGRTRIVPQAILRMLEVHPNVQVQTFEGNYEQLEVDLRNGDLDLVFGALREEEDTGLLNEPLFEERLLIIARAGHPLSGGELPLGALAAAEWILPRAPSPARVVIERCFAELSFPSPRARVESGDMAVIRGLLAKSDWLAIVSHHQFETDLSNGELVALKVELPETKRRIGIVTRRGALHPPAVAAMIEALRHLEP